MSKKVPVVKITTPNAAGELIGLPLEATVAMGDVAAAMRDGLLAFATSAGLVVMQQMLAAELTGIVGEKHAKLGLGGWATGTARRAVRSCWARRRSPSPGRGAATSTVARSSWRRGSASPPRTCCARSWSSGCSPGSPPAATSTSPNPSAWRVRRRRSRRCRAGSRRLPRQAMSELLARDLSVLETAVLMIDGLNVADQMITVALVITR